MAPWTLRDSEAQLGERIFARPLGLNEKSFYLDAQFNRTADCIRHVFVETRADQAQYLFGEENVSRSWVALKQQFPLLGSQFEEHADGSGGVDFVVREKDLRAIGPEEIRLSSIVSFHEAEAVVDGLLNGSLELLDGPLAQLFVLRYDTNPSRSNYFHIVFRAVHSITDGISNINITRTFLDILSSSTDDFEVPNLEDRLSMAVASDDLDPGLELSPPRRRWRRAIARVLHSIQIPKLNVGYFTRGMYF